ncbi:uncharacterized protein RJT21DRAFT_28687 [Scheffersomyces amazonensis]|uniref:uncharacterized protein n=1 Tax=Scheffersomyces amazonensis TaxID=1078765 RepID=UPI00315CD5CE
MSSSILVVAQYLEESQRREVARILSTDLQSNLENIEPLCGLLETVQLDEHTELYENISKYCTDKLFNIEDEDLDGVLKLAQCVPSLRQELLSKIEQYLSSYILSHKNYFQQGIFELISVKFHDSGDSELSNEFIFKLFKFLDMLFIHISTLDIHNIDSILLAFIAIYDEEISSIASKLLRWRIKSIAQEFNGSDTMWKLIFLLESGNKKSHAFVFWLRYLSCEDLSSNAEFKAVVTTNKYWSIIQNALVSDSHEHRKYCLSILQLTVKSITFDINNDYIKWNSHNTDKHLQEWSRFSTLFEILGIDTSLHQAEGGIKDITALISADSLIHPSWGFCLLSTGFKASMDSVRKFTLKLLFSIPDSNLHLLKYGLKYLEEIFLPYMMLASHFSVRTVNHIEDCHYGRKLTSFITHLLDTLTDEETDNVVYSLLKVLENLKDAFDPSRIYVTYGILKGLANKKVLKFSKHDIPLLKLFEARAEGEVFERTIQTINLRLLLNFTTDNSIANFLDCATKFIKFNGKSIYNENVHLFQAAFSDIDLYEFIGTNDDHDILIYSIKGGKIDSHKLTSEVLLAKAIDFGIELSIDWQHIVNNVVSSCNTDFLKSLAESKLSGKATLEPLWNSIQIGFASDDYTVLENTYYKLIIFNQLYNSNEVKPINFSSLISFYHTLLSNSEEVSKTVKTFYKLKEDIYGEFYNLISICYTREPVQVPISTILELLDSNSSSFKANMSMVQFIEAFITKEHVNAIELEAVVDFLCSMWTSLDSTRLQLNQKDLHIALIRTILHPKILSLSSTNDSVVSQLLSFSTSIIKNAAGRRSLLPTFTKSLSNYQVSHGSEFESLNWLPQVIVNTFIVYQLNSNVFKLEAVIADIFDKEIANDSFSKLYSQVYGPEEVSSKINLMAIINSIKSRRFANQLFDYIHENQSNYYLYEVYKSTDGFEEWRRIQLFSIILGVIDVADLAPYLDQFKSLIGTDPSPLARAYIEWIVAYLLSDNTGEIEGLMDSLLRDTLKPAVVNSYSRILFLSIKQLSDKQYKQKLLSKLITIVIPGATSNKVITRHFSLSLVISIYEEITHHNLSIEDDLIRLITNLYTSASQTESFGQYRSGDALLWDIKRDLNLVSISGGVLLRISDRDTIDFIRYEDYSKYLDNHQIPLLNHPIGENLENLWVRERKAHNLSHSKATVTTESPLQTKSGQWGAIMDVDEETIRGKEVVRSDLIVVSSLVDKPPNLGGICRLCDVLGAGTLTLNDIHIKNHPQFKNVAVTADSWMPMIEVRENDIRDYLQNKKKDGYTLIGLEQTDKSIELNSELKFPAKSLILLGKEKEGIPGHLLAELDFCVEIKQSGVIRSMNIQTAAAIIVHAYSIQHT